jgi:hypothetical protein
VEFRGELPAGHEPRPLELGRCRDDTDTDKVARPRQPRRSGKVWNFVPLFRSFPMDRTFDQKAPAVAGVRDATTAKQDFDGPMPRKRRRKLFFAPHHKLDVAWRVRVRPGPDYDRAVINVGGDRFAWRCSR